MYTSPISTLHHPTLISQTDRDPHRERGEQHPPHGRHAEHPKPEHHPSTEELLGEDDHPTTGLLIDVKG